MTTPGAPRDKLRDAFSGLCIGLFLGAAMGLMALLGMTLAPGSAPSLNCRHSKASYVRQ